MARLVHLSRLLTICAIISVFPINSHAETSYSVETVADNLDFPWSIAFLPNGDALFTELGGQLYRLRSNGEVSTAITGVPAVYRAGQGGLFDVILDPQFTNNQLIYLSYAAGDPEANATTVARARLTDDSLNDVEVLFTAQPTKYAPLHYGGRLAWLPQGDLLLTTGDGFDFREKAQATGNHFGKTIRIPVADQTASPFSEAPLVWSTGHRNPQGLAVSRSGVVYLHEHGPKGGDEVNLIQPGNNYGWPAISHGKDYNGANVTPFTEHPTMQQPVHTWVPSIAPSGLMIYEGSQFPAWQGDLFVGALVDAEVRRLDLQNGEVVGETVEFPEINARIRDIREGPQGSIYVLTDGENGSIIKITAQSAP